MSKAQRREKAPSEGCNSLQQEDKQQIVVDEKSETPIGNSKVNSKVTGTRLNVNDKKRVTHDQVVRPLHSLSHEG